jgi:hypothetical protein
LGTLSWNVSQLELGAGYGVGGAGGLQAVAEHAAVNCEHLVATDAAFVFVRASEKNCSKFKLQLCQIRKKMRKKM